MTVGTALPQRLETNELAAIDALHSMAAVTEYPGMRSLQLKRGVRLVVKPRDRQPGLRRMASSAIGYLTGSGELAEVRITVAGSAVRSQGGKRRCDVCRLGVWSVALQASQGGVRTGEREARDAMVEAGLRPVQAVVAGRTAQRR